MARKTNFFHFAALLAVSWITRTFGNLSTVPKNTVAKLGDIVEFECRKTEKTPDPSDAEYEAIPLEWTFFSANLSKIEIYESGYITHHLSSKYTINNTTLGRYNLIMSYVDLSFAGTYRCCNDQSSASAELIVIASDPVCSTNASTAIKEGDYIRMWCTVNYSGNWIPVMEWIRSNEQTVDANITYTNTSTTVTSSLTIQINSNDSGATFMCKTHFKPTSTMISMTKRSGDDVPANNSPHYQHFWNYTLSVSPRSSKNQRSGQVNDLFAIIGISVGALISFIAIATIICKFCKRGKAKPDVVPQVEQNNFDVSDRLQPQNDPPLYAEVQRSSNGFQVMENHLMPVYATVKKEKIAGDLNKQTVTNNYQQNESIPVYAEVKKMEKEKKILGPSGQIMMSTNIKPKQNYAGADGTQYMELDSLTELTSNGIPTKRPLMFNLVETYATIDHTMVGPPPPPSLPRRH